MFVSFLYIEVLPLVTDYRGFTDTFASLVWMVMFVILRNIEGLCVTVGTSGPSWSLAALPGA